MYHCEVCGFYYKTFDKGKLHRHHLRPKEYGGLEKGECITLCPNCHAIAHILLRNALALESPELYKLFEFDYLVESIWLYTRESPVYLLKKALQRIYRQTVVKIKVKIW